MHCFAHHRQALALISELRVQRYRVFLLPPNISPTFLLKSRKKCKNSLLWHISTTFWWFQKPLISNIPKDPGAVRSLVSIHPIARPTEHLAISIWRWSVLYPRRDMMSRTLLFHVGLFWTFASSWYTDDNVISTKMNGTKNVICCKG